MSNLTSAMEEQCQQMQKLLEMLDNELHLISTREPEALMQLVKDKESLLESIQTLSDSISQLPSQEEAETDKVAELKEALKSLLAECQYRTEINQKAVEQGQLRIEHLRNLLLESRAKESMTYDSYGKTRSGRNDKGISA